MQKLIGQIERILFQEGAFFIAVLSSGEKIRGSYFDSDVDHLVDAAVTLEGTYETHPKYGRSFVFERLHVNQNPLFFFLNRVIKGLTRTLSAELIERYGEAGLIEILEHDIDRLLEHKGIKKKRLTQIGQSWKQFRSMRELGEFLLPLGVGSAMLSRVAAAFKDVKEPRRRIEENPYVLTSVEGIGFARADEVALRLGIEPRSPLRIGAAMDEALLRLCEQEGNSLIATAPLFARLDAMLGESAERSLYEGVLIERIASGEIKRLGEAITPQRLYDAESFLIESFRRRAALRDAPIVEDTEAFLAQIGMTLGAQQREALELINAGAKLLFLVGYAGTGKSTASKALLALLAQRVHPKEIITCALSGIAAQRIGERSGFEGATIQSLLVRYEERDVMPYSVVLIDEASMINSTLFARLMRKIERDATVIVVGDDAQLPPIGAGNVLCDVLSLNLAPTVMLTELYRQSEDQAIATIANAVRQGVVGEYRRTYEDFRFIEVEIDHEWRKDEPTQAREAHAHAVLGRMADLAIEAIPQARLHLKNRDILAYLAAFQVITPMRGGLLGSEHLNTVMQEYFNPSDQRHFEREGRSYRLWDKVVHTKNENLPSFTTEGFKSGEEPQDRRIFNGMTGLLFKIDVEAQEGYVHYPLEALVVRYDRAQMHSHLSLAYALTIHKVQGMEYARIVMPMSFSHALMHNTKLLYTAITRAKKECIIVGEAAAFEQGCRKRDATRRETVMRLLGAQNPLKT
ncbi:MAG: AAA family ATPase [Campylobacterales bacterium]|nr:AAA family ATPase [Campylobacterales bacterium]